MVMTRFASAAKDGSMKGEELLVTPLGMRFLDSLSLMQCLFYYCRRDALVVEVNK